MKNISLKKIRLEGLKEVFDSLERAFKKFDIDFYLVGAFARDIWLTHLNGIAERRATRDIDFAIFIAKENQFEQLKEYLLSEEGFSDTKANGFRLVYQSRIQIDLMPFGAIANEDYTVTFSGLGLTTISTQGFKEVVEASEEITFDRDKKFKVCTLPGIAILKLIAWEDRPEIRVKDPQDLALIIEHYFEITSEDIYENHHDLFEDDSDLKLIAARVLGRHIYTILKKSELLKNRVINLLTKETSNVMKSSLAQAMCVNTKMKIAENFQLLQTLLQGIKEADNTFK